MYPSNQQKLQVQFLERIELLVDDPVHPYLRVHPLHGRYTGYWSMNVSGDVRAIYKLESETLILFALIGTHSTLYGS